VIDSYGFGRIVIDGVGYSSDVLVTGGAVTAGWRRREGHLLRWEDLAGVVEAFGPATLVIGRGRFGRMRLHDSVREALGELGVALNAEPTAEAVKTFNRLTAAGVKTMGAFHLTC
jgi:hypothetical protein